MQDRSVPHGHDPPARRDDLRAIALVVQVVGHIAAEMCTSPEHRGLLTLVSGLAAIALQHVADRFDSTRE